MITVIDLLFLPALPVSGFGLSASGMTLTIASGNMDGVSHASGSFLAIAPASGDECFSIWLRECGTTFCNQDGLGEPTGNVFQKVAWAYVSAGETSMENKEIYRYLPVSID